MTREIIHLNNGRDVSLCISTSFALTSDPQAVTCPKCIAKMELQPA